MASSPGRTGIVAGILLFGALLAGPVPARGQDAADPRSESDRLRAAAALEWRGRLEEAQAELEALLRSRPTSSAGLFSLERILRNRERVGDVLPWADAFLEREPDDAGVRYMKLRVLAEVDSLSALPTAADAWYRAEPGSAGPYREVARVYARSLGPERALEELRRGREALGDDPALALATGDLLAELGRAGPAVAEWSMALRDPAAEMDGVLRRVRGLGGADGGTVAPLVAVLVGEPTSAERRLTALRISLEFGDGQDARELAEEALSALPAPERPPFLDAVAEVAEESGAPRLALWALERRRPSAGEAQAVTLDLRMASAALQAGDTAAAVQARTRLTRSLPRGSVERRRILGDLIRVQAATASAASLGAQIDDFVRDYPEAPELDELVARAGAGLAARGDTAGARALLADRPGPLAARERGFLRLGLGEVEAGLAELERAVPGIPPTEATRLLETVALLSRLDGAGARALAGAAARIHRGETADALDGLTPGLGTYPEEVRPALLAWAAARAADAGDAGRARSLYRGLVDAYPEDPGFPDAALSLARMHLVAGETDQARTLLQQVLLEHPGSPVAPAARRELQRLPRGGVS